MIRLTVPVATARTPPLRLKGPPFLVRRIAFRTRRPAGACWTTLASVTIIISTRAQNVRGSVVVTSLAH